MEALGTKLKILCEIASRGKAKLQLQESVDKKVTHVVLFGLA